MAESDEYWSYLMAAAYAMVGDTEGSLAWMDHTVRVRGWVDYVFFTRHDRFLGRVREDPEFRALMEVARERHERFTDEGAAS